MSTIDYRASGITGSRWRRCNHLEAINAYDGQPSIRFDEEWRTVLDNGQTFGEHAGSIEQKLVDPSATFALRDPTTGATTGQTMTHFELYAALWSLYIGLAEARDAEDIL